MPSWIASAAARARFPKCPRRKALAWPAPFPNALPAAPVQERQPGGRPKNAIKHGLYAKVFTGDMGKMLAEAAKPSDLTGKIAIVRWLLTSVAKESIEKREPKSLDALNDLVASLSRLTVADHKTQPRHRIRRAKKGFITVSGKEVTSTWDIVENSQNVPLKETNQ